jgi:hypothetical protein
MKTLCVLNVWTCFFLLPFVEPFAGGLGADLGGLPTVWGNSQQQKRLVLVQPQTRLHPTHSENQGVKNTQNAIVAK